MNYEPKKKKGRRKKMVEGISSTSKIYNDDPIETSDEKIILKDIFLLPSPHASKVPRGKKREELSEKGFVSFAVPISLGQTELAIKTIILTEFKEKFSQSASPDFLFLKAVNDKLITQPTKIWNGKVIKRMTGNGPLYV